MGAQERRRASSGSPWEPVIGFSRAVRVGDRILVAGTGPVWPDGSCDPDPEVQAARCLEIIGGALADLGATLADVVRTRLLLADAASAEAVGRAHVAAFADHPPAATMVVVGLLDPRWAVEIEAEACVSRRCIGGPFTTWLPSSLLRLAHRLASPGSSVQPGVGTASPARSLRSPSTSRTSAGGRGGARRGRGPGVGWGG